MASIRKVVHRTGGTSWQARWRDPTGGQRSKNFPRRVDADRFLVTVEARKLEGSYIDPHAGRIRLGDFAEQTTSGWVNRRDSTKARDESYLRSLVLPVFAKMPIGAIGFYDVQEWITDLVADGYAPASAIRRHRHERFDRNRVHDQSHLFGDVLHGELEVAPNEIATDVVDVNRGASTAEQQQGAASQQNELARFDETFAQSLQKRMKLGAIDRAHPGIASANRRRVSTACWYVPDQSMSSPLRREWQSPIAAKRASGLCVAGRPNSAAKQSGSLRSLSNCPEKPGPFTFWSATAAL